MRRPGITAGFGLGTQQAQPERRLVVTPGESIQAAVDRARPGDSIVVEPGLYREVGLALIALGGKQPVVLQNAGGQTIAIAVGSSTDCSAGRTHGSRITGFVVKGFAGSGIALDCTTTSRKARGSPESTSVSRTTSKPIGTSRTTT